jgi:hypothetical protein
MLDDMGLWHSLRRNHGRLIHIRQLGTLKVS